MITTRKTKVTTRKEYRDLKMCMNKRLEYGVYIRTTVIKMTIVERKICFLTFTMIGSYGSYMISTINVSMYL